MALSLELSQTRTFALRLRIPAWAAGASVAVNGKRSAAPIVPGTFTSIVREWRSGDRVELDLPLRQRLQPVDAEHPNTVALSAGPLVLMRILDEQLANTPPLSDTAPPALPRTALLSAERVLNERRWTVRHDSRTLKLQAFAEIDAESYSVYQDVV